MSETITNTIHEIAKDKEAKLKQALIEGYDFVGVKLVIEGNKVIINYGLAKGELKDAREYDEVYNVAAFRDQ